MKMKCLLLIMLAFAAYENEKYFESKTESEEKNVAEQPTVVKIEEDEYVKGNQKTNYFGVSYNEIRATWSAYRWSKNEKKKVHNGSFKDEETAAHASDTLGRKLIENGEKDHKLNFPDDDTEVYPEKVKFSSNYIGVIYHKLRAKWSACRRSKYENKNVYNGTYKDEETAAHASDTLARKLNENGAKSHKLNFPNDGTEVYPEEDKFSSDYIGVMYHKGQKKWFSYRHSKNEKKTVYNGTHKNEETAAHASDTLAKKLIANGEKGHKLNFPGDDSEVYTEEVMNPKKKRKRPNNLENSQENQSHQTLKK